MDRIDFDHRSDVVALAVVFGAVSIPWTYGFLRWEIPLWPSFIGSATYYASARGPTGWTRTVLAATLGILYAAATIAVAGDAAILLLSVAVGVGMLLASLHPLVPVLAHGPAAFMGYAALFSVDAAAATVFGLPGLTGVTAATLLSFVVGTGIGIGTDSVTAKVHTVFRDLG